jgi:hypothetical protein
MVVHERRADCDSSDSVPAGRQARVRLRIGELSLSMRCVVELSCLAGNRNALGKARWGRTDAPGAGR